MTSKQGPDAVSEQYTKEYYWLAMDTATANMTIAVMKGLNVVASNESTVERNHSVRLIPEMQALLQESGIGMKDLHAIAAGRGPGSYTGVRIGVTVAKTLAWSLKLPLLSVSSIGALAFGFVRGQSGQAGNTLRPGETIWLVPLLDARRKQVFTALYSWTEDAPSAGAHGETVIEDASSAAEGAAHEQAGKAVEPMEELHAAQHGVSGVWRELEQDRIILFADWLEILREMVLHKPAADKPSAIVFTGEVEAFGEEAARFAEELGVPVAIAENVVHGQDVAWLSWNRLQRGKYDDMHGLVPNYTQLAEAEQKLLSRQK